jgi:hypothetical protein
MKVKADLAGKRFRCPNCQQPVTVPEASDGSAAGPSDAGPNAPAPQHPSPAGGADRIPDPQGYGDDYELSDDRPQEPGLGEETPGLADSGAACPNCGAAMEGGAVLCVECGYHLEQETVLKTASGGKKLTPAHWLAIGGVGFVLLLLAVMFLWPSGGDDEQAAANKDSRAASRSTGGNASSDQVADTDDDAEGASDADEATSEEDEKDQDEQDDEPQLPYAPAEPFRPEQPLPEAAEIERMASPADEIAERHLPELESLRIELGQSARRPEELLQLAKWCAEQELWLESEECLRSVLTVDPYDDEAERAYARLVEIGFRDSGTGTLSVPEMAAEYGDGNLPDGELAMPPPRNGRFAMVELHVDPQQEEVRLDEESIRAFAGDEAVDFVGFVEESQGEIQNVPRGREPPKKSTQIWEIMEVVQTEAGENGEEHEPGGLLVRFRNTRGPDPPRTGGRRGRSSSDRPYYRTRGDATFFEAPYKGPYSLVFALSDDEQKLTDLQYGDERKVGLLSEARDEEERAGLPFDPEASPRDRLIAIKNLRLDPTGRRDDDSTELLASLEALLKEKDLPRALYLEARSKIRVLRRRLNRIDQRFLPETDPQESHFTELALRPEHDDSRRRGRRRASSQRSGELFHLAMRFDKPARYYCRIEARGPRPDLEPAAWCWVTLDVAEPGVYRWSAEADVPETTDEERTRSDTSGGDRTAPDDAAESGAGDADDAGDAGENEPSVDEQVPPNLVFELWDDTRLIERRLLTDSGAALALLRRDAPLHRPYPLDGGSRGRLAQEISRSVPLERCQSTTPPPENEPATDEQPDRRRRPSSRSRVSMTTEPAPCPFPACQEGTLGTRTGRDGEQEPIECPRCEGTGQIEVNVPLPPDED